jgi:hypothetical protein
MAVKSQRMVYTNGVHVGTLNYGADGNVLSHDWANPDGTWANHTTPYKTPAGHREMGTELSVPDMSRYAAAKVAGDNTTALGILGASNSRAQPNQQKKQREYDAREFDSAAYWNIMDRDPNNMSEKELAGFAATMNNHSKMATAMRRSNPAQVNAAGALLENYGYTPNFKFDDPRALEIPTAVGGGGMGAAGGGGSELARINTNRAGRRSQGSSSYGGGRSSIRTSQQVNTV